MRNRKKTKIWIWGLATMIMLIPSLGKADHSLDAADGNPTNAVYVDDNGNVGIGTQSPSELLSVRGNIRVDAGGFVQGNAIVPEDIWNETQLYIIPAGFIGTQGSYGVDISWNSYRNNPNGTFGWLGINDLDEASSICLRSSGIVFFADEGLSGDFQRTARMTIKNNGKVGIGTTNPTHLLTVNNTVKAIGWDTAPPIPDWPTLPQEIITSEGYLGKNKIGVHGKTLDESGWGVYGEAIEDAEDAAGVVGIARGVRSHGVKGYSQGERGWGVYGQAQGSVGRGVVGIATGPDDQAHWGGHFTAEGTNGRGIFAKGQRWSAELLGNVLIKDYDGTKTLIQLGEGFDYAEGFDVTDDRNIEPGMVLVIDEENPGELKVSDTAYDTKVAGIVAGAKGLGSGVQLGGDQFDCNVALAGRVYCNVDATDCPVQPGDLLTTSKTPGHAMKVDDYTRAQGAILGKAMESLEKGNRGQILVLVTLQ